MSNFFAALDDSGDEAQAPKIVPKKEKVEPKTVVAEPSKPNQRRQRHDDRNTKSGRGRPTVRDGKRQYDRRSGTGRGKEIKKGGGGGRNWGSDKNDAKHSTGPVVEKATDDEAAEETKESPTEKDEEEAVNAPAPKVVVEEEEEVEDKTLSYEDYLKQKQRPDSQLFAPLKLKAVVDDEFAGKSNMVKLEEDFLVMGGGKSLRKKSTKKDTKLITVTPAFRIGEKPSSDRRDKREGGRGGGGGGRGDGRGGNNRDRRGGQRKEQRASDTTKEGVGAGFNVTEDAFPSL